MLPRNCEYVNRDSGRARRPGRGTRVITLEQLSTMGKAAKAKCGYDFGVSIDISGAAHAGPTASATFLKRSHTQS